MASRYGVVVIGRNEGERLVNCLRSALGRAECVVYVDSGSIDGSVARAQELGASVVELDPSRPFTAARGRNAGFRALDEDEVLDYVQFVDGDCEIQDGWLEAASTALDARPEVAGVCGRRRERHPDASPYNRLADLEWDTPIGEARAFGGDAMIRCDVVREVGGYDESLIAGEDPEFALRIRRAGFSIERLDREMTLHDAALLNFSQWWRRAMRGGHAYAEAYYLYRHAPEPGSVRRVVSIAVWGGIPIAAAALLWPTGGFSLLLLGLWLVLGLRVYASERRRNRIARQAAMSAFWCVIGKVAELQGLLTFAWNRLILRRSSTLIEYKEPGQTS